MKQWRYNGFDKADLNELYSVGEEAEATADTPAKVPVLKAFKAELVPGETFTAPEDWTPHPYPHPLFSLVEPEAPVETEAPVRIVKTPAPDIEGSK